MKILLSGINGHMGKEVVALCEKNYCGAHLTAGVDINPDGAPVPSAKDFSLAETNVDIIVDFSHHSCTEALLDFAVKNNLPVVIATTGQTDEENMKIVTAAKSIPVFFASNYSIGIALLTKLACDTARAMPDAEIEIIEKHHSRKLDAPSGTALSIAKELTDTRDNAKLVCGRSGFGKREKNDIGIHAVRLGNIVGEHEVIIGTASQTITLKHEAHSRALFAEGALTAAKFLIDKPAGLYDMKSMISF